MKEFNFFIYFQMNQQCKVCGEPAAGFHFGAFTCEGCKVTIISILYIVNYFLYITKLYNETPKTK